MINKIDNLIYASNEVMSLIIKIRDDGKLELVHIGDIVSPSDAQALALRPGTGWGCSVLYKDKDTASCLERIPLYFSESGRGDYRESPIELMHEDRPFVCDFIFDDYSQNDDSFTIRLKCKNADLILELETEITATAILRRTRLINSGDDVYSFAKLASACWDIPGNLVMSSMGGGWIAEAHLESTPLLHSRIVNESTYGFSSGVHNPAVMLEESGANEDHGKVYGLNLIYSGNHYTSAQQSYQGLNRVVTGISPDHFKKALAPGESFETPQSVISFSSDGRNGMSRNMHRFINECLVPEYWRFRERPILYNSWEGSMFSFTEGKLLSLAKSASKLGCELFVLDDGWYGERDDDTAGLGDYDVNKKKLPGGLKSLADKIRGMGMDFGLWFEPEAVNPNSQLYKEHPNWALHDGNGSLEDLYGRNELLLDLRKSDVRDYIVENVSKIIDEAGVSYVKWDMNRQSPLLGLDAHEYIKGLEDVLERIFGPRPKVLLETCSSGGNRFDLGMLRFGPQIWASDNTDPVERLDIQKGYSYFYPLSTMGSHVSASPHAQTLRATPLSTRGNLAYFGCLGYELDLAFLTSVEKKEVARQIEYYKAHRSTFQFGDFRRNKAEQGAECWQVSKADESIAGLFHRLVHAAPAYEYLRVILSDKKANYSVETKPQSLRVGSFGSLVKHISPVTINPNGLILKAADENYRMQDAAESFTASGAALESGVPLNNRFLGTGYSAEQRMQSDFGSNIYLIKILKES